MYIYNKDYKLLFTKDDNGYIIPILYDVEITADGNPKGKRIYKNSKTKLGKCMYDFIIFVKASSDEYDMATGKKKEGRASIYQWIIAYQVIRHLLKLDSKDIISAISRQAKYYWSV